MRLVTALEPLKELIVALMEFGTGTELENEEEEFWAIKLDCKVGVKSLDCWPGWCCCCWRSKRPITSNNCGSNCSDCCSASNMCHKCIHCNAFWSVLKDTPETTLLPIPVCCNRCSSSDRRTPQRMHTVLVPNDRICSASDGLKRNSCNTPGERMGMQITCELFAGCDSDSEGLWLHWTFSSFSCCTFNWELVAALVWMQRLRQSVTYLSHSWASSLKTMRRCGVCILSGMSCVAYEFKLECQTQNRRPRKTSTTSTTTITTTTVWLLTFRPPIDLIKQKVHWCGWMDGCVCLMNEKTFVLEWKDDWYVKILQNKQTHWKQVIRQDRWLWGVVVLIS